MSIETARMTPMETPQWSTSHGEHAPHPAA